MKRAICAIVLLVFIGSLLTFPCSAAECEIKTEVISFQDGSYLTISISEAMHRASGTKSGKATYNHYSSSGDLNWSAVLSGTFTFNGTSATCTASSCTVSISDTAWYVISKSASKNGNCATGSLAMGRKLLGITVSEVPVSMVLTCDANGNLS